MKLLYINKNINLSKPIVEQLRKMNFEVDVLIDSLPPPIDKASLTHRISNILHRVLLNDKTYFIKKEKQLFEKFAEKKLKNKDYDIAFFIRADMYSEKLIKKVKKQSKKMINYQWDGLSMYPRIFEYVNFFDRFFVFDKNDISKHPEYHFLPITNFYYSDNTVDNTADSEKEFDFFYVGVGLDERIRWIKTIEAYSIKNKKKLKAILTIPNFREEVITPSLSFQHHFISLEENEIYSSKSRAVIDFKMETHNGASFRVFECLQKHQKLISNNYNLKDYDFYHPDNIFLTDFEDLSGLEDFLQKPYHKIDAKIVEKYGIKNWMNYALDYGDYEPINLP